MFRLRLLICLGFFVGCSAIFAETGTIKGIVKDSQQHVGIAGANVIIVGSYQGASTRLPGEFEIPGIEQGNYDLRVSALGYYPLTFHKVSVIAGQVIQIEAILSEEPFGEEYFPDYNDEKQLAERIAERNREFTQRDPHGTYIICGTIEALPAKYGKLIGTIRGEGSILINRAVIEFTENNISSTVSFPNGSFSLGRVPSGYHEIRVFADGYQELLIDSVKISVGEETRLELNLKRISR